MVSELVMTVDEILKDIKPLKTKAEIVKYLENMVAPFKEPKFTIHRFVDKTKKDYNKHVIYWFTDPKNTIEFQKEERNSYPSDKLEYRFGGEFIGQDPDAIVNMVEKCEKAGIKVNRVGISGFDDRKDLILDSILLDVPNKTFELATILNEWRPDSIGTLNGWVSLWWD